MTPARLHRLRARAGQRGFTLVELLVVVVILAALAAIAVPIFMNQKGKADDSVMRSDLSEASKMLSTAMGMSVPLYGTGTSSIEYSLPGDPHPNQMVHSGGVFNIYGWSGSWSAADACIEIVPSDPSRPTLSWSAAGGYADHGCKL